MQYRIVEGLEIWWAEEKTSFGWERVFGTYGSSEEEARQMLDKVKNVMGEKA